MSAVPVSAAAALLALGIAAPAAARPAPPSPEVARGRQLYVATGCYQCHGYVGQGGKATGPALLPTLAPLPAFTAQLRHPVNEMPPYTAKVMPDADVAAIHAYLAALPPSPAVADIALLKDRP